MRQRTKILRPHFTQTMQQTLMWEGNKQIIIIVLRENKKNNSNLILFIILVIEETLVIKVIGEPVLKLNTGILKCQVPSSNSFFELW